MQSLIGVIKMITLKNLNDATPQEVFDQVANHLLTQREKSRGLIQKLETCVYKNGDGLKCAAGCLISDDEYNPDFEGRTWNKLVDDGYVPECHKRLIRNLQVIHDGEPVHMWKSEFEHFAKCNNLKFNWKA